MTELLTAAQMRAIEQAAIDSGEVTGLELMERAGVGVVEAILEEWPAMALTSHKAVVLCGPGNNGGDGFVVARLLKERGWEVEVFLYGDEGKLPVDAKVNCERWKGMGEISSNSKLTRDYLIANSEMCIDAVFGTGLSRPLEGDAYNFCWAMQAAGIDVAIDVPSGFCADSGEYIDGQIDNIEGPSGVELIVTFERAKTGHFQSTLATKADSLVVKSIGLENVPKWRRDKNIVSLSRGAPKRAASKALRFWKNVKDENKYSHGHALILSGPSGKTGAARLAARGALRIGAGVVTVACPPDALAENAAQLNAIMLNPVADATALRAVLQDERINALCLGPALGLGDNQAALIAEALTVRGGRTPYGSRKVVLDADALTLLSRDPQLFGMLHANCVLTPHGGEFARLFPDIAAKLAEPATIGPAYSKVDATRDAAKRAGCVVLYKGADTVIADPTGRAAINSAHYERSAPWLATAGSGDVLAGLITGLLARGFGPMQAAETAAWLHVECALKFGPGLIAEDIAEQLPKVFADLGL